MSTLGPTTIALDVRSDITYILVRIQSLYPQRSMTNLQELPRTLPDARVEIRVVEDECEIRTVVPRAYADTTARVLFGQESKIAATLSGPSLVVIRGHHADRLASACRASDGLLPYRTGSSVPVPFGFHERVTPSGQYNADIVVRAADYQTRDHVYENLVAAAWAGTRTSIVMRSLREAHGLLYFPLIHYRWAVSEPAWHLALSAHADKRQQLRRRLREALAVEAPVSALREYATATRRSLDMVDLSPEAQLQLAVQLATRGSDMNWLQAFQRELSEVSNERFVDAWHGIMRRMREAIDED